MTPPGTTACRSPRSQPLPASSGRLATGPGRSKWRLGQTSLTRVPGHQERGTWPSRAGSRTAASRVWSRARGRGCVGGHGAGAGTRRRRPGPPDLRRTALGRFLRERLESHDRPHVTGVAAPAHLPRVVGPARGGRHRRRRRLLVGGPVDGAAHPRVVPVASLIRLNIRLPVRQGMTLPWRPPTGLARLTEKPSDPASWESHKMTSKAQRRRSSQPSAPSWARMMDRHRAPAAATGSTRPGASGAPPGHRPGTARAQLSRWPGPGSAQRPVTGQGRRRRTCEPAPAGYRALRSGH